MTKAIVILSGGQDSVTCLFMSMAKYGKENVSAIAFDYAQRHSVELRSARFIAETLVGIPFEIINIGGLLGGTSPLTNASETLETYDNFQQMEEIIGNRVEKTFVPMRNSMFLTIGGNRAIVAGADVLVTGVCQSDNANYPDCTQGFIREMQASINESLGRPWHGPEALVIDTPLMHLTKAESIHTALQLEGCYQALAYSHTAYDGAFPPGNDHASVLRAEGFIIAGVPDPLIVRAMWSGKLATYPTTPNYQNYFSELESLRPRNKHELMANLVSLEALEAKLRAAS